MNANAHKLDKLENVKILEHVNNYFKDLNRNNRDFEEYENKNTQTAYEIDIRLFFRLVKEKEKGSELEYLSLEELQFTLEDFEEFKRILCDMRNEDGRYTYTNKTVNRKVAAMKSFSRYMAKKKIDGKPIIKDVSFLELVESEKEKDNHYGALEVSEVFQFAEWAREHERNLGEIKRLLILFSLDTCIRKTAQLSLKWSNFVQQENGVLVTGIDKGNKEFKNLISHELFKELLTIKTDSEYVFNIGNDAINDMMSRFRKFFNIPSERGIVFHSIRKAGAIYRYRLTGDVLEAKRALNHSSITTTQIYLDEIDYGLVGAVSSSQNLDMELFEKVDHATLLAAIRELKSDTRLLLNLKLQEKTE